MQYDERHTVYARRDIRNYWSFLQSINQKSEDCRYQLFENCDPFANCDCIQRKYDTDGGYQESNVELKGRDIFIEAYEDCLIDLYKVNQLQKIAYQSGNRTFIVVMYYPSKKLAIWEIDPERQYDTLTKYCNIHTAAPEAGKSDKMMVSLPLTEAKILSFIPIA